MIDVVLFKDTENAIVLSKQLGWSGLVVSHNLFQVKAFSPKSRTLIDRGQVDCVYGFETVAYKDGLHQRNAGLDHILAKVMKSKQVAYGVPFHLVLGTTGVKRAQIIGRIKQNIRLARKFKVDICLASFAEKSSRMRGLGDVLAFGVSMGMRPEEAKKGLRFAAVRIEINKKKREGGYVSEKLYTI
ncbi:MAG: RNase P subunit p30 family protein [Nanoarchaeota archaeon]